MEELIERLLSNDVTAYNEVKEDCDLQTQLWQILKEFSPEEKTGKINLALFLSREIKAHVFTEEQNDAIFQCAFSLDDLFIGEKNVAMPEIADVICFLGISQKEKIEAIYQKINELNDSIFSEYLASKLLENSRLTPIKIEPEDFENLNGLINKLEYAVRTKYMQVF